MASKVLVPGLPFTSLKVKKSPPPELGGNGFYVGNGDSTSRIAHLEHSVRFLQEQHRQMLNGLHAEIESLRERNRDLQFQLIFNKEAPKSSAGNEDGENEVTGLRREVERLELQADEARAEADLLRRKTEQLQEIIDAQNLKLEELEGQGQTEANDGRAAEEVSRAELRARLGEAERLVRRLRADAERQRREVGGAGAAASAGAGVTNLLFDSAAAHHAHLQCMKNSLIRASGMDPFGFQSYQYTHLHTPDFWREPLRDREYNTGARGRHRRPNTLPELSAVGQQIRSTGYANHSRGRGYPERLKRAQTINGEPRSGKTPVESSATTPLETFNTISLKRTKENIDQVLNTYPELKIVVTKYIPHGNVGASTSTSAETRSRARRTHRKPTVDAEQT
ncbi:uncharacterized protein LOC126972822 isoform X1 [Leptidea sinapis]|uniref:uncharacterized protein LOC126972822 isoform X1 n=1 Tax=Leptidea sinapis TaxID=189913 RepID=UPI0021C42E95|nr:uncharacterized protein LOC126972822 isoform X1 [Leptidea sinapis]